MNAILKNIKVDVRTHTQLRNAKSILEGRRCEKNPEAPLCDRLTVSEVAEMAIVRGIKVLLSEAG